MTEYFTHLRYLKFSGIAESNWGDICESKAFLSSVKAVSEIVYQLSEPINYPNARSGVLLSTENSPWSAIRATTLLHGFPYHQHFVHVHTVA